jgi:hypothetical protein
MEKRAKPQARHARALPLGRRDLFRLGVPRQNLVRLPMRIRDAHQERESRLR